MISFIIATIYKAKNLPYLIQDLERCDLVSEILIVEDAKYNGFFDGYDFKKVKIIPFKEQKYCNGSWNLGLSFSKNFYYALCNDDILFSTKVIEDVLHFYKLRPNAGVIGMHPVQYNKYEPGNVLSFGFMEREKPHADGGWGALMFNHKDNLMIIPEDLKHWCGDTYYLYYSKYPCYNYFGEKFFTGNDDHSTSTDSLLMEICKEDQKIFDQKYKIDKPLWRQTKIE